MLKPIFWKKVQGQNILGCERLQNTKYLVSKCCFKQIPKVTSILVVDYLSESKTQLVNQRKQKVAFNPGTAQSPEIQSYRMWWGAASPVLNDTPVVYIYMSYNRTNIENAYILINTELLDGNKGHQEETHNPTHRFRRLFLDLLSMEWRGCASAMGAIKLSPSCSSPKLICQSIQIV